MRTSLYEHLLPTLGARALPALFLRLKSAADEPEAADEHLLELVAGAIATIGGEEAEQGAADLLGDRSPLVQRAAMKVLARRPTRGCLDRLWQLHSAMQADKARFLRPEEPDTALYRDSFDAMLSCVKLEPGWLADAIRRADATQPVHDLAYLLGNLEGQEALWRACKPHLFQKVARGRERCLAANIFKHRDADERKWLIDRVGRQDDLLGPWALRALCRLDPDAAVQELPRLPIPFWGTTSRWCFAEILRQRPDQARACVRRMLEEPDALQVAIVYQDDPNAMDVVTLDTLLDHLSTLLARELRGVPEIPSSSSAFSVLCHLLPRLSRLEQLERFERRRGSMLEARLTSWLLRRGPIPDQFARSDQQDVLRVLAKIGGDGYTRVINRYLNSTNFYARIEALKDAPRRPDWETLAHLIYLSQKDEVHEKAGAVEQRHAVLALAAVGEYGRAVEAVMRWGLLTLRAAVQRLAAMPLDDRALAPAFDALREGGERLPGAILALGTARQSARRAELADRVRSILASAEKESKAAHACVIALWLLGDRSDQMVTLVTPHLDVPAHRHDAVNALIGARSDTANDALAASIARCFDTRLAVHLLNQARTAGAVAPLVRQALEKGEPYDRKEMQILLLIGVEDSRALELVIDDRSAKDTLQEAAFARAEGVVWFVGSKEAAIRHLARYDSQAAWEAARVALEDTQGKDRERYPDLLAEIDPLDAGPFLMDRMRVEADKRVRWAIGRALSRLAMSPMLGLFARLSEWVTSSDAVHRQTACEVMGWLDSWDRPAPLLRACLEDVGEQVSAAAEEALRRLRDAEHVWEIARAITAAANDERRQWRLLDALIALADPGDEHQKVPAWCQQVGQGLPPAMRDYLVEGLKRRRKELAWEAKSI
jgi:hypothetical protein